MNKLGCALATLLLTLGSHSLVTASSLGSSHLQPWPQADSFGEALSQVRQAFRARPDGWVGADAQRSYFAKVSPAGLEVGRYGSGDVLRFGESRLSREGAQLERVGAPTRDRDGSMLLSHASVTERLRNTAAGLEQTWELPQALPGSGDLLVRIDVAGRFVAATEGGLHFATQAAGSLFRFGKATWIDATGAKTPIPVEYQDGAIALRVSAATLEKSAYPAVLDPLISPELAFDMPAPGVEKGQQTAASVAFDGTNYFAVWEEECPTDITNHDVVGARFTANGEILDPAGIHISSPGGVHELPRVVYSGSSYLVVWQDCRHGTYDIYAARVSSSGTVLDPDGVPIAVLPAAQTHPQVASNGSRALIVWQDDQLLGTNGLDVSAAFLPTGSVVAGASFPISGVLGDQKFPTVASVGTDFLVAWEDHRPSSVGTDVVAARVKNSGAILDLSGFPVSSAPGAQGRPAVASGGGQFFLTWEDARQQAASGSDIFGARVDSDGLVLDAAGILISAEAGDQVRPAVTFDGQDFLVAWQDGQGSLTSDLVGAWLTQTGNVALAEVPLSAGLGGERAPALVSDGLGTSAIAYETWSQALPAAGARARLITYKRPAVSDGGASGGSDAGAGQAPDAGVPGTPDAGAGGTVDAGSGVTPDAAPSDAGAGEPPDAGTPDAGQGGTPDAGTPDAGPGVTPDAGTPDSGSGGTPDAGSGGTPDGGSGGTPVGGSGGAPDPGWTPTPDAGTGGTTDAGSGGTTDAGSTPTPDAGPGGATDAGSTPTPDAGSGGTTDAGSTPTPDAGSGGATDAGSTPAPDAGPGGATDAGSTPTSDAGSGGATDAGSRKSLPPEDEPPAGGMEMGVPTLVSSTSMEATPVKERKGYSGWSLGCSSTGDVSFAAILPMMAFVLLLQRMRPRFVRASSTRRALVGASGSLVLLALLPSRPGSAQTGMVEQLSQTVVANDDAPIISQTRRELPPTPPADGHARLHFLGSMFIESVSRQAGGEVGATLAASGRIDLGAAVVLGKHVGFRALAEWHPRREGAPWLLPFVQLRGIAHPVPEGMGLGLGGWGGVSLEAGPGRARAGVLAEFYSGPAGYYPYAAFAMFGYEVDLLKPQRVLEYRDRVTEVVRERRVPEPVRTTTLRALITDLDDKPLEGDLRVVRADGSGELKLQGASSFETPLEPGDYRAEASAPGYLTRGRNFTIRMGDTLVQVFQLRAIPAEPMAQLTPQRIEVNQRIEFEFDKATLLPSASPILDEVVDILLRQQTAIEIRVEGHTCAIGAAPYNLSLSQARARTVRAYLIERGVEAHRLTSEGFGMTRPVADNSTEAGRVKNRRVQFEIVSPAPPVPSADITPFLEPLVR